MSKLVDGILIALIGGGLVAASYHVGARQERKWWRAEIEGKSSRVKAAMSNLDRDAPGYDAVLVQMFVDADAQLAEQQNAVAKANTAPPPVVAADDPCPSVVAQCLRRPRSGGGRPRSPAPSS